MSLAPKIGGNCQFINPKDKAAAYFTETWLKETVPDKAFNVIGYHIVEA